MSNPFISVFREYLAGSFKATKLVSKFGGGTSRTSTSRMQTGRTASPRYISRWTMGESNSRLPDANRMHYHYANGPHPGDITGQAVL